jgi:hypothetical protein
MLTDGDAQTDAMIQGASVQTFSQAPDAEIQYPVAWHPTYRGGTFITVGRDIDTAGGVYDINHTQVDTFINYSSIEGQHLDGTLDTNRMISYAVNWSTGDVVQFGDSLFNSPVTSIYNAGQNNLYSITYNAQRDSLFLGGGSSITEISVTGSFLNSFNTPGLVRSLAYDADGTMWYLSGNGADIVQIDAVGNELSRTTVNLGGNYFGGEIAPVPEPATFVALGIGIAALVIRRRK